MSKTNPKNKKKKAATKRAVNPVTLMKQKALAAAAIVSQVLIHFGAGYGVPGGQIFAAPDDAAKFSNRLMRATMKNFKKLDWDDLPTRDGVCGIAFKHGGLAKAEAAGGKLTWPMIEKTLDEVKKSCPPGGAGGGLVCTE